MAKASITKKFSLAADGILDIVDNVVSIESADSGELISLANLLADFKDKPVKLSIVYNEDYFTEE